MVQVAKEIWEHLLKWGIKITARSSKADVNNPNLDNLSLVSKGYQHVNEESNFAALEKDSEQDSTTGTLDSFRVRLQEEGISKVATNLYLQVKKTNI